VDEYAEWLRAQPWPLPALEQTHRAYVRGVDPTNPDESSSCGSDPRILE
jgi:hypothetical protein